MEFLNSCRVCRTNCTTFNSQNLTTQINGTNILDILAETIPIDFSDEISLKLPQKICFGCFETFMGAYELQKVAIESDEIFRESLRDQEHPVIIKEELIEDFSAGS
jgi:hypothetical protein